MTRSALPAMLAILVGPCAQAIDWESEHLSVAVPSGELHGVPAAGDWGYAGKAAILQHVYDEGFRPEPVGDDEHCRTTAGRMICDWRGESQR